MMVLVGADASRVAVSDGALGERQLQAQVFWDDCWRWTLTNKRMKPGPHTGSTKPLIIPFFAKLLPTQVAFRQTPWRAAGPPSTGGSRYAADSVPGARSQSFPSG